ncbi:MAG: ribonuclease G, partial [Acidocella sp. 35-58-6]
LSGGILVDFAGMKPKARLRLIEPLTTALKSDPLPSRLLGFSNLGFAEISRPRIRPPLHEILNP